MAFYAGKVVRHDMMNNPTLLVLTDRNDLDDQLFGTFSGCHELLRQKPVQAEGRDDLKEKLRVASGGVVFTTIQKFAPVKGEAYPMLSDRPNIVVIADEAHRSQYGLEGKVDRATGNIDYGFAKHLRTALPNASFIGFTGTPVALGDRNTQRVFGEYIDIYDIQRAVEDGATVRIYYEGRLAKLDLKESEKVSAPRLRFCPAWSHRRWHRPSAGSAPRPASTRPVAWRTGRVRPTPGHLVAAGADWQNSARFGKI